MAPDDNGNDLIEPLLAPLEDEEQRNEVEHAGTDMNVGTTIPTSSSGEQAIHSNTAALVEQTWERGEMQSSKFRDAPFAIIFLVQFIAIAIHGSISLSSFLSKNTIDSLSHQGLFDLLDRTTVLTSIVSVLSFSIYTALISKFFTSQSRIGKLIAFGLWITVVSAMVTSMALLYKGMILSGLLAAFYGVWGTFYYFSVKDRIPFAASNLNCGISAIRQNTGIIGVGAILCLLTFFWMMLWTISLLNMTDAKQDCSNASNSYCSIQLSRPGWIFPWALFLFWTMQVMRYSIHTMAAGVTATWYFNPQEAFGICSLAVRGSVQRSLTTSFGSICLGALLIAVIQCLDMIVKMLRNDQRERNERRGGCVELLLCCLDCILRLVEDVMQYFNKWAFVFVGVYGYPYLEAGKKVMTLFEQRGWSAITDDYLSSIAIQLLGLLVMALSFGSTSLLLLVSQVHSMPGGSFVGLPVVALAASVVFSTISSAVCTIIVCFAEAPAELERNHGTHSMEMREAWQKAYPLIRC